MPDDTGLPESSAKSTGEMSRQSDYKAIPSVVALAGTNRSAFPVSRSMPSGYTKPVSPLRAGNLLRTLLRTLLRISLDRFRRRRALGRFSYFFGQTACPLHSHWSGIRYSRPWWCAADAEKGSYCRRQNHDQELCQRFPGTTPRLGVCGEAADGAEAEEKAQALRPDLVLMDFQCRS